MRYCARGLIHLRDCVTGAFTVFAAKYDSGAGLAGITTVWRNGEPTSAAIGRSCCSWRFHSYTGEEGVCLPSGHANDMTSACIELFCHQLICVFCLPSTREGGRRKMSKHPLRPSTASSYTNTCVKLTRTRLRGEEKCVLRKPPTWTSSMGCTATPPETTEIHEHSCHCLHFVLWHTNFNFTLIFLPDLNKVTPWHREYLLAPCLQPLAKSVGVSAFVKVCKGDAFPCVPT